MRLLKIKVVGDVSVGKTSFLRRWYLENFPDHEETHLFPGRKRTLPTVQDTFFTNITVDRESFVLTFWDTVCGADFQKLRPLEYEGTDIFLVFFDIANPSSFQSISTVWVPEVRHYMPVTPILVVGNKIDLRTASNAPDGLISVSKGQELADRLESHYCESSCATGEAVHNVIQTAVRLAIQNQSPTKKGFKVFQWQKKKPKIYRHGPNPPVLSPPGKMPQIKILPSTFTDDLRKMYRDAVGNNNWDIRFLFSLNNQPLLAHKIILCTGSSVFHDFFVNNEEDTELSQLLSCEDSFCSCCDSNRKESKNLLKKSNFKARNGGNTQGLVSDLYRLEPKLERKNKASYPYMERKMKGKLKSCLHLNNSVPEKAFDHVLEFLYTASPKVPSDAEDSFCAKVISLSQRLGIPSFREMCENITNSEAYLNSSLISTVLEERKIAMEKFFNKPCFSDILFHVNNSVVHAHKAILMVRSEVMAAMFGGGFSEGDSKEVHIKGASTKSFLALLLFLYTDTLPKDMTVSDYRDLLVVADRFCHLQLISICEAAITEKIDTEIKKNRLDSTKCSEVINLLLTGQAHNAYQLARWCLYVISTNYTEFEACDDFDLIKGDNLRHVLEHRWPPLAYLKELEEFKRKTGRA